MMQSVTLLALLFSTEPVAPAPVENALEQTKNGAFIFDKYPPRALAAKEQGDVEFKASYDEKGSVLSCEVLKSSGHKRLDNETCDLIVTYARLRPEKLIKARASADMLHGIVEWRIPGEATPGVSATTSSRGDLPDRIICKRTTRVGSLYIKTKQCLTKREWDAQAQEVQDTIGEAQRRASQRQQ